MTSLRLRTATATDADEIQAIYAPMVEHTAISFEVDPPSVSEMAARIEATLADYPYLMAERHGRIAGYAYASQHRTRAAYSLSVDVTVYIADEVRRSGVGRALYTALLADLQERGFHAAFAGIALPNESSVGLHESVGFTALGIYREVGRKFGHWHDVGWWQRLL
ncbi:acetyltransferase [Croceibacterium mercuriale]|uniref:Acetyltransferase n=1 Tax=Croceibacterium mercuriale TaxID=1572751 RepID=A0A0B2BV96_9SPHN|nr:arsinothricin resistance N-acetyltransferase ArsN1 family B [Croceibacterium mercuriale]KHL25354.1 acetyltransferase [Croceibacterium mercuriale]